MGNNFKKGNTYNSVRKNTTETVQFNIKLPKEDRELLRKMASDLSEIRGRTTTTDIICRLISNALIEMGYREERKRKKLREEK